MPLWEWECKGGVGLLFYFIFILFKDFIYLFLERVREGERNINVWLPLVHSLLGTWPATQACALGWELNRRPFDLQAGTQSTEPYQPGLDCYFILFLFFLKILFIYF